MFKFKSYNIKKAEEKNEASSSKTTSSSSKTSSVPSYATGTLKKTTSSSSKTSSVPSYATGTLKKTTSSSYVSPKVKTMPSAREIKEASNYQPPEYSKKIYPKKTVSDWKKNDTYSSKNKTGNVVIPSPKKKLERK